MPFSLSTTVSFHSIKACNSTSVSLVS